MLGDDPTDLPRELTEAQRFETDDLLAVIGRQAVEIKSLQHRYEILYAWGRSRAEALHIANNEIVDLTERAVKAEALLNAAVEEAATEPIDPQTHTMFTDAVREAAAEADPLLDVEVTDMPLIGQALDDARRAPDGWMDHEHRFGGPLLASDPPRRRCQLDGCAATQIVLA